MNRRLVEYLVLLLAALTTGTLVAQAADEAAKPAPKTIRVFRVGSSSFGPQLLWDAKRIVDATGKFVLEWDEKKDSAGYTRLDQFVTQPGLYQEWLERYIPKIQEGKYDFVVFQTIDWLGFTPEQQAKLLGEVLPALAGKIRETGAQVILYDKFVALERSEKDPRAQAWARRYPEGVRFNYLLHVMAAKQAGIDKITFGGGAVQELWGQSPFQEMRYLYNDSGHPGLLAHYISACNLSYLMTGIDPVGSPVRAVGFTGFGRTAFEKEPSNGNQAFYDAFKERVKGEDFEMTEAEARTLKETAMKYQREWGAILKEALADGAEYAKIEAEVRRIQGETLKFEEYGVSPTKAKELLKQFSEATEGELNQFELDKIRRKTRGHEFAKLSERFLPNKQAAKTALNDFNAYWDTTNNKLRDDVYFELCLYEARCKANGDRAEVTRAGATHGAVLSLLHLPGQRILLERIAQDRRQEFLATLDWTGASKRHSPLFAAYQKKILADPDKLLKAWALYLDVWSNPDLLDKFKESKFSQEVFLEADKEFERRNTKE